MDPLPFLVIAVCIIGLALLLLAGDRIDEDEPPTLDTRGDDR